jgi:hypothetical protein
VALLPARRNEFSPFENVVIIDVRGEGGILNYLWNQVDYFQLDARKNYKQSLLLLELSDAHYTLWARGFQLMARGTSLCGPFNVSVSNLQLGPFLAYGKSGRTPQDPQFGITVFV